VVALVVPYSKVPKSQVLKDTLGRFGFVDTVNPGGAVYPTGAVGDTF
jgi:hypothetical protein